MTEKQSKLNELLVDEDQLNEELLYDLLSNYVKIGNKSGQLVVQDPFNELDSRQKVTVVLLSQKARFELDKAESESLSPTEISELSGIKKGTVYPAVRDIEDEGLAENNDGSYHIPAYNFERAKSYIKDSE